MRPYTELTQKWANWQGFSYSPWPSRKPWGTHSSIRGLTEWFLIVSNTTWSIRNGLRSPFKKSALKLFPDLFLWEISGRKEPSQTCSQERDYQKDENNMEQQKIPREYHSGRLTTFVSFLRKSGFKQNNYWKRIYFNEHIPDHRHIKNRLQKADAHLRAKTKYKMVLEVTVQIQLKVTSIKCLLCIGNCLAFTIISFNTLSNTERQKLLTPLLQMWQ